MSRRGALLPLLLLLLTPSGAPAELSQRIAPIAPALELPAAAAAASSSAVRGAAPATLPPVYVGTLDGSLHAIDARTGDLLWQLGAGPVLQGLPQVTPGGRESRDILLPDPRNGQLYVASPRSRTLKAVDMNLRDIVQDAPFTGDDGSVYLGQKTTRVYAVDPQTGQFRNQYLADDDTTTEAGATPRRAALFVGRTEYNVVVRERDSRAIRWNITLAEYTHPRALASKEDLAGAGLAGGQRFYVLGGAEDQVKFGSAAGWKWTRKFNSPAINVYTANAAGALLKVPLHRLPQRSAAPLAGPAAGALLQVDKTGDGILYASSARYDTPLLEAQAQAGGGSQGSASSALAPYASEGEEPSNALAPYDACHAAGPGCMVGQYELALPPPPAEPLPPLLEGPGGVEPAPEPASSRAWLATTVATTLATLLGALSLYQAAALRRRRPEAEPAEAEPAEAEPESAPAGGPPPLEPVPSTESEASPYASKESPASPGSTASTSASGTLRLGTDVLGHGSHGTIVYEGEFDGRRIAVKRMLREYYSVAEHEVQLLRRSDDHPNVIRYFCMDVDAQFLYIGLELCLASLVEVVEQALPAKERPAAAAAASAASALPAAMAARLAAIPRHRLAGDMMAGLEHLHRLNIVHRDIKPHNVLISQSLRAVISDFGLCAALPDNQSSFQTTHAGTTGWTAPEMLRDRRMTRAVDVFSAGCVLHYLLHASHPYGLHFEREMNIRRGRRRITRGDPIADDVLLRMLEDDAARRFTAAQVRAHPFFWTAERRLAFLMDVSDRVEKAPAASPCVVELERNAVHIVGTDWRQAVSEDLLRDLARFRKYNWGSTIDLLRAARNKKHHYRELSDELKRSLGPLPDGFFHYFHSRFPRLFVHVYHAVRASGVSKEDLFQRYYA